MRVHRQQPVQLITSGECSGRTAWIHLSCIHACLESVRWSGIARPRLCLLLNRTLSRQCEKYVQTDRSYCASAVALSSETGPPQRCTREACRRNPARADETELSSFEGHRTGAEPHLPRRSAKRCENSHRENSDKSQPPITSRYSVCEKLLSSDIRKKGKKKIEIALCSTWGVVATFLFIVVISCQNVCLSSAA